ncbi:hypothetical protein [Aquimarina muelleri]|uniref:Uncharacterized protein n=1 Tax=Aquimarina muelleri TaxID=279356 RepID=A0A918N2S0_9FLAO|nr:hypothetical protein [Aquimarina muelleri]MCX2764348.1 hypothetical protein [Aquimarina muelleri]GGX04967.1 hypothetical protein GCM10007384_03290 [Aquimarina muelleri]
MITQEEVVVQKVFKQLDGMSKIEVYDILFKIESMLLDFKSPIQYEELKKTLKSTSRKINVGAVDNFGHFYLEDQCEYIKIYKVKTLLPNFLDKELLYFFTPWQLKIMDYTTENLKETFQGTYLETVVNHFLETHTPQTRNPVTNRFILLEFLDQMDLDS